MIRPDTNVNSFYIYGSENCPNCVAAKKCLENIPNLKYNYIDIGKKEDGAFTRFFNDFKELVPEKHRTVPVIFYEGNFIGGYTQLCRYLSDNEDEIINKIELEISADF